MKKIVFTGIILVLVMMFVVTCEEEPETGVVEYTDVVYSQDGSEVTLYLDGVGVPVTPAQRAINLELATMAFDYFEVVFVGETGGTGDTARAIWELGQLAGIADVPRGGTSGINYGFAAANANSPFTKAAIMFVGKKSDKTLLGIGRLSDARFNTTSTGTTVNGSTNAVTFSLVAIKTGLLVSGENIDSGTRPIPTGQVAGVMADSFTYTAGGTTGYTSLTASNSSRSSVNGSALEYPMYSLPATVDATVNATYTFSHVTDSSNNYWPFVKVLNTTANGLPKIQKRVPRFMNGGRYMEPKDAWTTTTSVKFYAATAGSTDYSTTTSKVEGTGFGNVVGLQFKIGGTGVFSFYIEIPVYAVTTDTATYGGMSVPREKWFIRTGVGSELYSLDDGAANGGCVFMSVGASASKWIDIDWVWVN